jgi:hypothetical protein
MEEDHKEMLMKLASKILIESYRDFRTPKKERST